MASNSDDSAIQEEPSAFLSRISLDTDPILVTASFQACKPSHWPSLNTWRVMSIVMELASSPKTMVGGLKAFAACLQLITHVELDDEDGSMAHTTFTSALLLSRKVFTAVWQKLHPTPPDQTLLSATSGFLHMVVQLTILDEAQKHRHFISLIEMSPIFSVAMHCWLYSDTSHARHQADLDRLHLIYHCDSSSECFVQLKKYIDDAQSQRMRDRLDIILMDHDVGEGTLIECIAFLLYLDAKDLSTARLRDDLWKDVMLALRRIVKSSSSEYDVQLSSVVHANTVVRTLLERSDTPIELLHSIFSGDGASLLADVILMIANHSGETVLRRPTLLCSSPTGSFTLPDKPTDRHIFLITQLESILPTLKSSPSVRETDSFLSLLAMTLKPLWHPTLSKLRELTRHEGTGCSGAGPLYNSWCRLGSLVGLHRLVDPLVGCSFLECPMFMMEPQKGEAEELICSRCGIAQYCNATCQKGHWGRHKKVCRAWGKAKLT